jgi:homoserine trans-succinylase
MPRSYFQAPVAAALMEFRRRALRSRDIALLSEFPEVESNEEIAQRWRLPAVQVFSNWLSYLASRRRAADRDRNTHAESLDHQAA